MANLYTISAVIEAIALTIWVGGLTFITIVVAPAVFATSPTREVAGQIFGLILKRSHLIGWGCGVLILLAGLLRYLGRFSQETYPAEDTRYFLGLLMLGLSLYSGLVVTRRIERLRGDVIGGVHQLGKDDPRWKEFSQLHGKSMALTAFTMLLGLSAVVLLGLEVR